jgi:hypothetical protein
MTLPTKDEKKLTTTTYFDELANEWIEELDLEHTSHDTVKGTIILATSDEWKKQIGRAS